MQMVRKFFCDRYIVIVVAYKLYYTRLDFYTDCFANDLANVYNYEKLVQWMCTWLAMVPAFLYRTQGSCTWPWGPRHSGISKVWKSISFYRRVSRYRRVYNTIFQTLDFRPTLFPRIRNLWKMFTSIIYSLHFSLLIWRIVRFI